MDDHMPQQKINMQFEVPATSASLLAAQISDQSWAMMKQHYDDRADLWHIFADQRADEDRRPASQDIKYFDGEAGAQGWKYRDIELQVSPNRNAKCIYDAIFDVEEPVFTPPLNRRIVHLYLPFPAPDSRVAECSLNDVIYWLNGNQVVAAGMVDCVLYDDIIITANALLVPVVAMPFIDRFKPFSMPDAIDEENQDDYHAFVADRESATSNLKNIQLFCPEDQAKTPCIAFETDSSLGHDLLNYIDDRCREAKPLDGAGKQR
jgi:hypothetical protein